ncbi:MAG: MFS transporter [Thermoplasmata archaeon]
MPWYKDKNLIALSTAFLLANVGWGMAWPYLPVYVSLIGGGIIYITMISIMFNLFGSLAQYPWARISDRTGHKKVFISIGNAFSGIFFYLISLTTIPIIIVEYRILQGIFSSMSTPTASALIVEIGNENIGLYFGIFNSFIELGYTIGSLIGSLVYVITGGIDLIFIISMILFLISALVSQGVIKEKKKKIERSKIPFPTFRNEGKPGRIPLHIKDALSIFIKNKKIMIISIAVFFVMSASGEVYSILPIYFSTKFSETWIGFLYGVESISVVAFTPIFGYLSDKSNIKYIFIFGVIGYFLTFFLYYLINSPTMMIIAEIISGMKWSAFIVSASTYVGLVSPKGKESRSQAILNMAQSMGWVMGPAVAIPIVTFFGFSSNIFFSFIFLTTGLIISVIFVKNIKGKNKNVKLYNDNHD